MYIFTFYVFYVNFLLLIHTNEKFTRWYIAIHIPTKMEKSASFPSSFISTELNPSFNYFANLLHYKCCLILL